MAMRKTQMNCLEDDLLAEIFRKMPLHRRARLASVCRRWRTVLTGNHAAAVWQTVCVDETTLGPGAHTFRGGFMRWCQARSRHIRDLRIVLARGEAHEDDRRRLLMNSCAILLATSSRLQRLSVWPTKSDHRVSLPRTLLDMISIASTLEYLDVVMTSNCSCETLAQSVPSLKNLKVAHMEYTWDEGSDNEEASEFLFRALCRCPMLEELQLRRLSFRCLPTELAAATRLTMLVLSEPARTQLDVPTHALPRSLQQLRLTESIESGVAPDDEDEWWHVPRDFRGMDRLQSLQLAAYSWAEHWLPFGLTSLRLEGDDYDVYMLHDMIGGISSLVNLEKLCFYGFQELGKWPVEVAATLRPLYRLRALAFYSCELRENPARDILTRLTLLNLRSNRLATLSDALPAGSVHNLRLLDVSGNTKLLQHPPSTATMWPAANIAAVECGWANLQVLGIQPALSAYQVDPRLMRATAMKLQRLLQRQADAAGSQRPPATVVWERVHEELLQPARKLAAIP